MKYFIDVDTGIDDAMGLMLLHALAREDVVGVSTVSGNVSLETATLNTRKILTFLDWPLPLYKGAAAPLVKPPFDAADIHGADGLNGQLPSLVPTVGAEIQSAVEGLLEASREYRDLVYIATGPLTNLALAAKSDPGLMDRLHAVFFMGGAFACDGNVTPHAEFNVYCDPEATDTILGHGAKVHMIGLDVTRHARLRKEDIEGIGNGPVRDLLTGLSADYMLMFQRKHGDEAILLHDPLAVYAAVATAEDVLSYESHGVAAEHRGESRGRTREDKRRAPVQVATHLDRDRFVTAFCHAMELG